MNFVHYRLNMAGNHSRGEKKNLLKRIGSPNGEGVKRNTVLRSLRSQYERKYSIITKRKRHD